MGVSKYTLIEKHFTNKEIVLNRDLINSKLEIVAPKGEKLTLEKLTIEDISDEGRELKTVRFQINGRAEFLHLRLNDKELVDYLFATIHVIN